MSIINFSNINDDEIYDESQLQKPKQWITPEVIKKGITQVTIDKIKENQHKYRATCNINGKNGWFIETYFIDAENERDAEKQVISKLDKFETNYNYNIDLIK